MKAYLSSIYAAHIFKFVIYMYAFYNFNIETYIRAFICAPARGLQMLGVGLPAGVELVGLSSVLCQGRVLSTAPQRSQGQEQS